MGNDQSQNPGGVSGRASSGGLDVRAPQIPMPIETERLIMRPITVADAPAVLDYKRASWPEFLTWMIWVHPPSIDVRTVQDEEQFCAARQAKFQAGDDIPVLAFHRQNGRLIGSGGLHKPDWNACTFTLGFAVRTDQTGQGYGAEIARGLVTYAFNVLNAQTVFSMHASENIASGQVLTKVGFTPDPTRTGRHELPSGWTDERHYKLARPGIQAP